MSHVQTVLVADGDLGFVFWLGQTLHKAGYQVLPAMNCSDAVELLRDVPVDIDLVVVNPAATGVEDLVGNLRSKHWNVGVLGLLDKPGDANILPENIPALPRPPRFTPEWTELWLDAVHSFLPQMESAQPLAVA